MLVLLRGIFTALPFLCFASIPLSVSQSPKYHCKGYKTFQHATLEKFAATIFSSHHSTSILTQICLICRDLLICVFTTTTGENTDVNNSTFNLWTNILMIRNYSSLN
ncbi:hypothetical protein SEVIR_3G088400v4 [Setaria viridis]|uniref:Secreted protein n=1 Tax=Setaria viridis TaxID=4556 RepID=A0A4U6V701_SETVI|nr:hypothetical protein SEVIR_3G088400v2 [Setaria viridis]